MNRVLFSTIIMLLSHFGFSQSDSLDCSQYKTGVYIVNPPAGDYIKIKRTKTKQIERYNRKGKKHKFSIEWSSDCSYILKLEKTPSKNNQSLVGKGLYCVITQGEEDFYTCIIITPEHPDGRICYVTKLR